MSGEGRGRRPKEPRVVAELGRPETPDETARRKAENTRKHYANQTAKNLTLSILASLGIVLFLVLVVVRPGGTVNRQVIDYRSVAEQSEASVDVPLASPALPDGWSSNRAEIDTGTADGVSTWYVGLITPADQFIALEQGIDANDTWVSAAVQTAVPNGTTTIGGLDWLVYDQRDADDPGNYAYSLTTTVDRSSYVLHGTADDTEFETLATALAEQIADETSTRS
ncbi:exodeoxyribonuclease VII small subunit [Frigoribacterium sp. Leaf164]|jgi:hypothetical protein|uniref:DUF4245 domain-containing protein n=1 Tax=unclassified Frigoribacterium TaxID=2627005 RepID=UPI0006F3156E|nr:MULTISPECIES: DUF4245 domain-containing protein [unclassified Frigoribacterium]KQR43908.1 exodeoxyribonuclease VII small subunit [Frigoribacterium sp. Leaf164]MBD8726567.1 DUF4245 domain-containing protein [Frigoribacterium sp. CFBP 13707]QNE43295.1 DUF4245 domain-containing protein [Frigoribacterium sp. NBH87]